MTWTEIPLTEIASPIINYDWGNVSPLTNFLAGSNGGGTAGGRYDSWPTFRFLYDGKFALFSIYNGGGNGCGMRYWNMEGGTPYQLSTGVTNVVYNGYFGSLINHISPDGSKGYFIRPPGQDGGPSLSSVSSGNVEVRTITFSTPGDFTSATSTLGGATTITTNGYSHSGQISGITWYDDGNKFIMTDESNRFNYFECATPYDPTTIQPTVTNVTINLTNDGWVGGGSMKSAAFADDGRTLFCTSTTKGLAQYDLSTPWDMTTRSLRTSVTIPNSGSPFNTNRDVYVHEVGNYSVNGYGSLWIGGGYNHDSLYEKLLPMIVS